MQTITIKQGNTLSLPFTSSDDLTGMMITSQVRNSAGVLTADLATTIVDATHFTLSADTALWSIGKHYCDIEFADATEMRTSPTFQITVISAVTE